MSPPGGAALVSAAAGGRAAGDPAAVSRVLDELAERHGAELVALIQGLQAAFGFLPREALEELSRRTGTPLARVYGVATFYSGFSLVPAGRRQVKVCHGTACHVRGAERISDALSGQLGIETGGVTPDGELGLGTAACLGCCSLAPVISVGETVYGRLDPAAATRIVAGLLDGGRE